MNKNRSKILALKYRPRLFEDLIGQEVIAETISNAIKIKKTPNAYLLTGIRGVGKTTTARLIAKALNCLKNIKDGKMCNENEICQHCSEIENSNHIDVLEMDAASKTGIDDVRELIDGAKYNPTSAAYKIFIIDEVHMLSKQAFNGLLKTLEEPPEKLKFILATTEVRKIPITILSRCQRFDLKRVSVLKISDHLKKISNLEKGKISNSAIELLAKGSEGSVRDGVSLLDRAIVFQSLNPTKVIEIEDVRKMLGLADKTKLINLLKLVFEGNEKEALVNIRELLEDGLDAKNFLNDILELIYLFSRRINLGPIEKDLFISEPELRLIDEVSKNLNMEDLGLFWQLTLKTIEDLKVISNENIALEMYLIQLVHIKNIDQNEESVNLSKNISDSPVAQKKQLSENDNDLKSTNSLKDQLKNIQQIKTMEKGELNKESKKEVNTFQVRSFSELISLAEKNKESELKYDLDRNVKLVNFENGKIDINFNENLNKNFIKNLSKKLFEWTGKRWIITLSKEEGLKTLYEKRIDDRDNLLKKEKQNKISKEMTSVFPDAELIDVKIEDD
ncbi:MAG: DNA polymerase III, subunit gamma and tau [Alphaproteobacteria bacterium]|nr:DNA polymerase III, subunit gamma and tau [Alphaproteobacteria bacterium]